MSPEDHAFFDPSHSGSNDIILSEFFQHCVSYLSGIFCRHGKRQCHRRQDHCLEISRTSCYVDPAKLHSKDAQKNQADPEARDRYPEKRDSADQIIRPLVLIYRGEDSAWYGEQDHQKKREERHLKGRPKTFHQFFSYRNFKCI